jgi:very-short-patch-repair endonuclease
MLPYDATLKQVSRKLRRDMTDAERRLWSRLRGKQILGVQFYRQKPIGEYTEDVMAEIYRTIAARIPHNPPLSKGGAS